LRTPLTSIRGSLGLIDGGVFGDVSPTIKEYLTIAKSNCDRLIGLINDILDIRKIEANKLDLNLEYVLPEELLRASADSLRTIADEKKILIVKHAQTKRKVHVDSGRIVQILTNLISNAVKFSEPGKHVDLIVADGENGMVRFSVTDEGPGISDIQLKKLFGKFQQLDSSDTREKGGTGLGLAISKSLVELHHGRIGVASEVGKGSTFWFEVPVRTDS
jgi:signal transduction histidine kinase